MSCQCAADLPSQMQLRLPAAPLAWNPHEKLHTFGNVGRVVEIVGRLIDPPARFSLDPGD